MSAGERSCNFYGGNCPMAKRSGWSWRMCTTECAKYRHDGKTKPDTLSQRAAVRRFMTPTADPYAPARLQSKRARYVERLGASTINRRRDKRRRRAAAWKAQAKHCLTCGTMHAGWCPVEAFEVMTCYECGNACLQPCDVGSLNGVANCGQCGSKDTWNLRPATLKDMREHWTGYGEGQGQPFRMKGAK